MHTFAERYFAHLQPNEPMIAFLRELRDRGYRLAMLTNNVREWEPRWRAMLPVDELFEVVVDSAFVGLRKPDPAIYRLTCDRLGVAPDRCLFVDDVEVNCTAAADLGMAAVVFRSTAQAIAEMRDGARARSVVGAEPVPEVELEALRRELDRALAREVRQDGLERLLLGDAGVEGLLAAEARRRSSAPRAGSRPATGTR